MSAEKRTQPVKSRRWGEVRANARCNRCGDAGWVTALLKAQPVYEYAFRCSCAAGAAAAPASAPVWDDACHGERYRRISALELQAGATVETIRRTLLAAQKSSTHRVSGSD